MSDFDSPAKDWPDELTEDYRKWIFTPDEGDLDTTYEDWLSNLQESAFEAGWKAGKKRAKKKKKAKNPWKRVYEKVDPMIYPPYFDR